MYWYCLRNASSPFLLQSGLHYVEGGEVEDEAPPEVVEEEFDLSDIMSEEVDAAIVSKEEQLKKVRGKAAGNRHRRHGPIRVRVLSKPMHIHVLFVM